MSNKILNILNIRNLRKGLATNSSSTHSILYKNKNEIIKDLNVMEENFYDRYTNTIAATKEAKIKYVLAAIMRDEELVNKLKYVYPEIKKYFPLVKQAMENDDYIFGMYDRGGLTSYGKYPNYDFDFIRKIIDDDNVIIVGGSDEEDFVYSIAESHLQIPHAYFYDHRAFFKNGNYYVLYNNFHINNEFEKVRLSVEKGMDLIPEYPELIDLKITEKCNIGCSYCYQASTNKGKHADINFIYKILSCLPNPVEFSIGGGDILEYPDIEKLFKAIKNSNKKHIINVTINQASNWKLTNCDLPFKDMFKKYVDGIGVSINNVSEIRSFYEIEKEFNDKYVTCHIIPELIGYDKTMGIINELKATSKVYYHNILLLGAKLTGRASNMQITKFTDEQLDNIFSNNSIGVDTSFINHYEKYLNDNFDNVFFTKNEGEYSMYIDAVTQNAYKSSYQLDKPYNIKGINSYDIKKSIKNVFQKIRKDSGFKTYKPHNYWDDNQGEI